MRLGERGLLLIDSGVVVEQATISVLGRGREEQAHSVGLGMVTFRDLNLWDSGLVTVNVVDEVVQHLFWPLCA